MSFSLAAVGSKEEVIEQLGQVKEGTNGTGALCPELAQLIAKHLGDDDSTFVAGGHKISYVVTASGHSGGGSALGLNVSVTPHYVRSPRAEDAIEAAPRTDPPYRA